MQKSLLVYLLIFSVMPVLVCAACAAQTLHEDGDSDPITMAADIDTSFFDTTDIYFDITTTAKSIEIESSFSSTEYDISSLVTVLIEASDDRMGYFEEEGRSINLGYTLKLPEVHISDEIDEIINDDIKVIFYDQAMYDIDRNAALFQTNYRVYLNDNILSLIIVRHEGNYVTGMTVYCANIDLFSNRIVHLPYVLKEKGYDAYNVIKELECPDMSRFYINDNGQVVVIDYEVYPDTNLYPEADHIMVYTAANLSSKGGSRITDAEDLSYLP